MTQAKARPRAWVVVLVVGWCAVLAGGIVWAARDGEPTAREQTTIAEALPVVDRATAQVAAAASVDGLAVVAISDFAPAQACTVTMFWPGAQYQRVVTAIVAPGTEQALLHRVADRLPASYHASVRDTDPPILNGDAGLFVNLNATRVEPGVVRFVLDTGDCRPPGSPIALDGVSDGEPTARQRAPIEAVLTRLGLRASEWTVHRANCPGGATLSTVEATAGSIPPGPLDVSLRGDGQAVVATPELYAFLAGGVGLIARGLDGRLVVTATTVCPQ